MNAFKQGSISGFFSNLINALINTFLTTTKRMARMIREGFFSLVRGVQMLLFPPGGMTYREAAHEASKILLAGGIVIGAIAVEEWLEKQLAMIPLLASIARFVVPAIVGALTALVTLVHSTSRSCQASSDAILIRIASQFMTRWVKQDTTIPQPKL